MSQKTQARLEPARIPTAAGFARPLAEPLHDGSFASPSIDGQGSHGHELDGTGDGAGETLRTLGGESGAHEMEAEAIAQAAVGGEMEKPRTPRPLRNPGQHSAGALALVREVLGSPGCSLDPEARAFFERRFGHDFARVRVHADERAAQAARSLRARAFTLGSDIVFAASQYSPHAPVGQRLLAHELAHVMQQQERAAGHTLQRAPEEVTFKPEVITVPAATRARLLKGAGWHQTDVIVTLIDFRGEPMQGMRAFAEFKAPGVAAVDEAADVAGGAVTWSGVWLKPQGTVRLMAVSTGAPTVLPQGVTFYQLPAKGPLKLRAVQKSTEVTVTAKNSQEAASKVGAKGTAGVDFEVFKLGGEVSGETSTKTGSEVSVTWKVVMATGAMDVTQVP